MLCKLLNIRTPETTTRKLLAGAAVFLSGLAIVGCGDPTSSTRKQASNTASNRFGYDYADYTPDNGAEGFNGCLSKTPYDTGSNIVIVETNAQGQQHIKVSPAAGKLSSLVFDDGLSDYSLPLQPASEYTKDVLKSYNCNTTEHNPSIKDLYIGDDY
jgi:hypothetical protein